MAAEGVTARVEQIIGAEGIRAARAPIEEASGPPSAVYTDSEWLALEQERIFARSWVFAGAAAELGDPGHQLPTRVAGAPVVLVRTGDGEIKGFHNVCRHRGAVLVDSECTRASIRCPYHHWTYGLDGTLRVRPHFHGPDDHDRRTDAVDPDLDLAPVRTGVWNGCVFVNLDGRAPALEEWLADFEGLAPGHDFSTIRWIGKLTFDVAANWKFVYENFMEGYHVFAVHPRLLEHAPMSVRRSGEWVGRTFHNGYLAPELTAARGEGLPHYPGLTDEQARRGAWFVRFPQFGAEVFADQFTVLSASPVAPDRTIEELHVFVVGDEAAHGDEYAGRRDELMAMWDELNREDVGVLERLQQGRRSPAYAGGRLSPHWEEPIQQYGRMVIDAILADELV